MNNFFQLIGLFASILAVSYIIVKFCWEWLEKD